MKVFDQFSIFQRIHPNVSTYFFRFERRNDYCFLPHPVLTFFSDKGFAFTVASQVILSKSSRGIAFVHVHPDCPITDVHNCLCIVKFIAFWLNLIISQMWRLHFAGGNQIHYFLAS